MKRSKSVLTTKYVRRNGKTFKQTIVVEVDHNKKPLPKTAPPDPVLAKKVKFLILDSPFTHLFKMVQRNRLFYLITKFRTQNTKLLVFDILISGFCELIFLCVYVYDEENKKV